MYRSINIIGYGFVGGAVGHVCEQNGVAFNVCDMQKKESGAQFFTSNLEELIAHSEAENDVNYYFIAVPTPSNPDDSCNVSIIHDVLMTLNTRTAKNTRVIIKSTMVPGTCRRFSEEFKNIEVILSPEFLRETTFKDDMYNAEFVLVGLPDSEADATGVDALFRHLYSHKKIDVHVRSYEECEMFKYTLNVHLAVKVWYFNEIYEIAAKMGVDYERLKSLFPLDARFGEYGTRVPGPDGKFGYGLSCLPKETRGMMKLQEELGIENDVLKEIIKRNNYFRTK